MIKPVSRSSLSQATIRQATAQDYQQLANLIHFQTFVHRHLDYRAPLEWLGEKPFRLIETPPVRTRKFFGNDEQRIAAALACPPDPPDVAWLRLFAADTLGLVEEAWELLWPEAYSELQQEERVLRAAAVPLQSWMEKLLDRSSFENTHHIVMLRWEPASLPEKVKNGDLIVRPMNRDDLEAVHAVDQQAFVKLWRNSPACLDYAFHQAAIATVAELGGEMAAYQISTGTPLGGHVARLAVLPGLQGQGIGRAILRDAMDQFTRRGARAVTVNTQADNQASLALYFKMGFHSTGEKYPVYELEIERD